MSDVQGKDSDHHGGPTLVAETGNKDAETGNKDKDADEFHDASGSVDTAKAEELAAGKKRLSYYQRSVTKCENKLQKLVKSLENKRVKNKDLDGVKDQAVKTIDAFTKYSEFHKELLAKFLEDDSAQDMVIDFTSRGAKYEEILYDVQAWIDKMQAQLEQEHPDTGKSDKTKSKKKSKTKVQKSSIVSDSGSTATSQKLKGSTESLFKLESTQIENQAAELQKLKADYLKKLSDLECKIKVHSSVGDVKGLEDALDKLQLKQHKSFGDYNSGSECGDSTSESDFSDSDDEVFKQGKEPSKGKCSKAESDTDGSSSEALGSESESSSSDSDADKKKKQKKKKKKTSTVESSDSESEDEKPSKKKKSKSKPVQYAPKIPKKKHGHTTMLLMPPKLPKFSGDHMKFKEFLINFEARVVSRTDDVRELLSYLHECMEGDAAKLVQKHLKGKPEKAYERIWRALREEYENPQVSANSSLHKLTKWKRISNEDSDGLEALAEFLDNCLTSHKYLRHLDGVGSSVYVHTIFLKLPGYLQNRWNEQVLRLREKGKKFPTFKDIVKFTVRQASLATDPLFSRRAVRMFTEPAPSGSGRFQSRSNPQVVKSFATKGADGVVENYCLMCMSDHEMDSCPVFLGKPLADRKSFLILKRLCFGCLKSGHVASQCPQRLQCRTCQKPHPTSLHFERQIRQQDRRVPHSSLVDEACMSANIPRSRGSETEEPLRVFHAVIPVRVSQGHSGKTVTTYAFLDGGSSASFISEALCGDLNMTGSLTSLKLKTLHGTATSDSVVYSDVRIADLSGGNMVTLPRIFSRPDIGIGTGCIARREVVARWPHLHGVSAEMGDFMENVDVGLLLGSNCVSVLEPREVIPANDTGLFAVRVMHGWTVQGAVGHGTVPDEVMANRAAVKEAEDLREMVVSMYESEFRDDATPRVGQLDMSPDDRQFVKLVDSGTTRNGTHYVVPLPLRSQNLVMPNNRVQAMNRSAGQMKKMSKDPQYRDEYVAFVSKMLERGYAREVTAEEAMQHDGRVWYIPHHGVMHPTKRKLRVVFDCAARYGPACLNDVLYQGPNLNNTLVGVLTRFRQHHYAFTADIEAMYHQVQVPKEQQSFLRFVWWRGGDLSAPLTDYCMCSHVFGAVSSPSVAIYVLRKVAEDHAPNDCVREAMIKNFYVDDLLTSCASIDDARKLALDLHQCCLQGGFRLTKYVASHEGILEDMPAAERAETPDAHRLDGRPDVLERTLGLYWQICSDTLRFAIEVKEKPFTRRGVLALISSVFDPLGALAPAILPAKRILQLLSKDKSVGWDQDLPEEHRGMWERWLSELPMLNQLELPRSFGLSGQREEEQDIRVYADASLQGQAAVAFIRVTDGHGGFKWEFVAGKARVAPLRTVATIPRMELAAAVNAVTLAASIRADLQYPVRVIYHTDSESVLKYLANQHHRQPVFVSNRVRLILGRSDLSQWKHVPSEGNPADVGSRGLTPAEMLADRNWLLGPGPMSVARDWSVESYRVELAEDKDDDHVMLSERAVIDKLTLRYSTWPRMCRAVVYLRKFMLFRMERKVIETGGKVKDRGRFSFNKWTTGEEMASAELGLLRAVQSAYFKDEIKDLTTTGHVRKSSAVVRLSPILCEGLVRVGGRIERADLPYGARHPVLLPGYCDVTAMLVRAIHLRLSHVGPHHTFAHLRQRFWVLGGLSTVKRSLYGCVVCRKVTGPFAAQQMAPLPKDRVTQAPPFTNVGLDYFGPFFVKRGRSEVKRYGVVFVCLAVKACHIEVASTLDTSSFILALRRFVSRRGAVERITSDNGRNFVGAQREITEQLASLDHSQIHRELASRHISWSFNPPYASHMGGIWERQIRTIRRILNTMLTECPCSLSDESLRTLMCEVECVINSRPLTTVLSDHDGPLPLTPETLLTMKSSSACVVPGIPVPEDIYARREWKRIQLLASTFWHRWTAEYLSDLQSRQRWTCPKPNLKIGDVVLIKDEHLPRGLWPLGLVTEVVPGEDTSVREVVLKTAYTAGIRRSIHKLILLFSAGVPAVS